MTIVKTYDVETATARFDVTISKATGNKEFLAKYYGTTPKFAQVMNPGDELPLIKEVGSGSLKGTDLDSLLQACVEEIEKIDGKVISVREH